jgi:hypothetical protein
MINAIKSILFFVVTIILVFVIGIYIYTLPLRLKRDYSREVSMTFVYHGDEYTINSVVKCINKGPKINMGTMEWYTEWYEENYHYMLKLKDGKEVVLASTRLPNNFIKMAFDTEVRGSTNELCDIVLLSDSNAKKIDLLMRFGKDGYDEYGKDEFAELTNKNLTLQDLVIKNNNRKQKYINSNSNLFSIRDKGSNKNSDVEIKLFSVGKKKPKRWIRSFDLLLPNKNDELYDDDLNQKILEVSWNIFYNNPYKSRI